VSGPRSTRGLRPSEPPGSARPGSSPGFSAALRPVEFPKLPKYELLEEIGHGGMATVYRARDVRLGREVAVKIIHRHLRENAEVGTRFIAEARAAAKLRHPGIVEVYDVSSEDDSERYLVVELLRGATLRKVLLAHREMPAEVGACIVLELCEALAHAHEASIIHRDIKPENVLVELPEDRAAAAKVSSAAAPAVVPPAGEPPASDTPADTGKRRRSEAAEASERTSDRDSTNRPSDRDPGNRPSDRDPGNRPSDRDPAKKARADDKGVVIKLTDFGIAKILDAQGVTSTGQVLGSPAHMAPEQIEGGDVDARTDVFGLGVLMYECLVGHLPFEGKNPAQVLRRVLEGSFAAVDRERPSTGGRWGRIVAGALAREAADRTASPGALGEAIRGELGALGITDPRAEITAYFADPTGYADAFPGRLVPRLIARGEAARKTGDVPGAAADFNRALALAPHDLAILKRIGALTSSAGRRQLARRAAAILAGSAALGVAAFGVARAVRAHRAGTEGAPLASAAPLGSGDPGAASALVRAAPDGSASGGPSIPSASAGIRPLVRPLPTLLSTVAPPPVTTRDRTVQFMLSPKGAKLTVDGNPVSWFGASVVLSPGPHTISASMNGSKCCKAITGQVVTVTPPPAGDPTAVQALSFALEIQEATVTLVGAPRNGQLSCSGIGLVVFAGQSQRIKPSTAEWTGPCKFTASIDKPPKVASITLRAGESNDVPWQAGE
jgi:eukaryotic-like serine/threonine-protein kinase